MSGGAKARKHPAKKRGKNRVDVVVMAAIAFVILAVAALAVRSTILRPKSPSELAVIAKKHSEVFPIPPIHGTMSPQAPYRAGIEAYRRGEYRVAAQKFWLLSTEAAHWPGLHFYRGLALLNAGDAAGAAAAFEQHLRMTPGARPARWHLALAYLTLGREKPAREQLEALAAGPEQDYHEKARVVLEEIR